MIDGEIDGKEERPHVLTEKLNDRGSIQPEVHLFTKGLRGKSVQGVKSHDQVKADNPEIRQIAEKSSAPRLPLPKRDVIGNANERQDERRLLAEKGKKKGQQRHHTMIT